MSVTTIVLATDGSADASLARHAAADLARRSGARLHVVTASQQVATPSDSFPLVGYGVPGPTVQRATASVYEGAARAIAEAEASAAALPRGAAEAHVLEGRPADVVLDLAQELRADLVVVGSRGHGPVRRLLLGSVVDAVVRHSDRPVLVVRGHDAGWPCRRLLVGLDGSAAAEAALLATIDLAEALVLPITLASVVAAPSGDGMPEVFMAETDAVAAL